ncbi:ATPase [Asticcacaulis sp. BYS171W]|uniref:ATPase n=1 Tax=Asticcacaulis aquaticus TaxID=2984212 RepID=A0ABT5HPU2_9CAUL|nr:ATP12 family protein [Asticcacaulis aquaticus]MDC7682093.1 ATPase [Asticcacaulis aquaticus]
MTYKAEAPSKRTDQVGHKPKRFWTSVEIAATSGGYGVNLDGRPVKTPLGQILVLPNFALAALVGREWETVEDYVDFTSMPLTRLGFAAMDHMESGLDAALAEAARFSETDLVCYPADYPQALIERETAAWQPIIDWSKAELGIEFVQQKSLMHQAQPVATINGVQSLIREVDIYTRAGLLVAIPLLGSVALALALWKGRLSGEAAFDASRIGEAFQMETWGDDAEAVQRAAHMKAQAISLEAWFRALI